MTRTADGKTRALQTAELFKAVRLATAVYRSELAAKLRGLGYGLRFGRYGEPQIEGYTEEFLKKLSARSEQIDKFQREHGVSRPMAALATRQKKLEGEARTQVEAWLQVARENAVDPLAIRAQAEGRGLQVSEDPWKNAQGAVTYSLARNFEREAVADERQLIADALNRGQGLVALGEARGALNTRLKSGEVLELESIAPRARLTTARMLELECANLEWIKAGRDAVQSLAAEGKQYPGTEDLTPAQRQAVKEVLESRDQVIGFVGVAGS